MPSLLPSVKPRKPAIESTLLAPLYLNIESTDAVNVGMPGVIEVAVVGAKPGMSTGAAWTNAMTTEAEAPGASEDDLADSNIRMSTPVAPRWTKQTWLISSELIVQAWSPTLTSFLPAR